jgi:hypothetical protein
MSYKGPSLAITAGKPATLTIDRSGDAPGRSDRLLRPRRPHHLASAAPLPASWAATVRVLVFGGSRSPRRECVGRVLWPGGQVPQGVCEPFLDILRVPASRPQDCPAPPQTSPRGPQKAEAPVDSKDVGACPLSDAASPTPPGRSFPGTPAQEPAGTNGIRPRKSGGSAASSGPGGSRSCGSIGSSSGCSQTRTSNP